MEQKQNQAPTYESIMTLLQENAQFMKESSVKFDRELEKSRAQMGEENQKH
jgi:hypothetical protein